MYLSNNFYYILKKLCNLKYNNKVRLWKKMSLLTFALAHSELGISHFTTDLILVLSFAIVTALPMSLLRTQIQEDNVKSRLFKSTN